MSTTVNYKGQDITTVENQTKTLLTQGKYLEGDILLTDITQSGTITLKEGVLRSDAELVKKYNFDNLLVHDLEIAIPAYSTTAKTLVASASEATTVSMSTSYDYQVYERLLAYPIYKEGTAIATGRVEYWLQAMIRDIVEISPNSFKSMNGSKSYGTRIYGIFQAGCFYRELYWSSASALTTYSTNAYGVYMTSTAPTVSGTTLTIKTPAIMIRGHSTYLRSAVWSTIEDIRYQWISEVWRVPKGNLNLDGWGARQSTYHIFDNIQNNGGTLT